MSTQELTITTESFSQPATTSISAGSICGKERKPTGIITSWMTGISCIAGRDEPGFRFENSRCEYVSANSFC